MLRLALRSLPKSAFVAAPRSTLIRPSPAATTFLRFASSGGLDREAITSRVLDVLKSFEKVDGGKLTPTAAFTSDLGLDSLDSVEVVMAIEEEFAIEIPDAEADEITSVGQAIDYIAKTPEAA